MQPCSLDRLYLEPNSVSRCTIFHKAVLTEQRMCFVQGNLTTSFLFFFSRNTTSAGRAHERGIHPQPIHTQRKTTPHTRKEASWSKPLHIAVDWLDLFTRSELKGFGSTSQQVHTQVRDVFGDVLFSTSPRHRSGEK